MTSSTILIELDGVDITTSVLFDQTSFESQLAAIPGQATVVVSDPGQTFSATTGDEVVLTVDGVRLWGGYVMSIQRSFAFPVVSTATPAAVTARRFTLRCVDYNVLFDKRVLRNTSNYLSELPPFALNQTMGSLISTDLCPNYLDLAGDGIDYVTYVDTGFVPRFDVDGNPDPDGTKLGAYPRPGSYWRVVMDEFSQFGFVYYIDASKNLHFHEVETTAAPWGFSDTPNGTTTIGMREYEDDQDASGMANDALVWGGSEFAGADGGTVFARAQNASSIAAYGRWQYAEIQIGKLRGDGQAVARANVIVAGNTTGTVGGDTNRGLSVLQKMCRLAWFGHDVPSAQHLVPGMVTPITMTTMTEDGGLNPLELNLPLRSVRISFPTLPEDGSPAAPKTYVRFDGSFGVQLSDQWWMWKYLRDAAASQPVSGVATADNTTNTAAYGSYYQDAPSPAPNGVETVFTIPFAYISNTSMFFSGPAGALKLLVLGTDYTESDPAAGEFTLTTPPGGTDSLWVSCRLAGNI